MKKLLKNFPLTIYAVLVILFVVSTDKNIQYDSHVIHVFFLIVLPLPLTAINQILVLFDVKNLLLFQIFPIFVSLILDLLLLSIRKGHLKKLFKKLIVKSSKSSAHNNDKS